MYKNASAKEVIIGQPPYALSCSVMVFLLHKGFFVRKWIPTSIPKYSPHKCFHLTSSLLSPKKNTVWYLSILGSHHLTGCRRWQESSLGNKPCVAFILMEDHRLSRRENTGDDRRFCNGSSAWCVTKEILIPINNITLTHIPKSYLMWVISWSRLPLASSGSPA